MLVSRGRTVSGGPASASHRARPQLYPRLLKFKEFIAICTEGGLGKGALPLRTGEESQVAVMVQERWGGWHRDSAKAQGEAGRASNLGRRQLNQGALAGGGSGYD